MNGANYSDNTKDSQHQATESWLDKASPCKQSLCSLWCNEDEKSILVVCVVSNLASYGAQMKLAHNM